LRIGLKGFLGRGIFKVQVTAARTHGQRQRSIRVRRHGVTAAGEREPAMNVNLVMFRDPEKRRDFQLSARDTTIGRKDDCDIRIPLGDVSRHHARITMTESAVFLQDLGSANGTYLNNQRVKEKVKLSPGDHMVIGPVVFTVQVDGEPQAIKAVKTKLRRVTAAAAPTQPPAAAPIDDFDDRAEEDPISALEALASSADQTAINPFEDEDDVA